MAFLNEDEEELDPSNPQQASQGSGVISGGTAGGATAPQTKPGDNSGSGGFVGIKQYLDANKPQAAKLGDQTAGVINTSAQQAREGVGALNQEASNTIKGATGLDSAVSQKLMNTAEGLTGDERQTIKNTAGATYKGPENEMGLSSYQNAAKLSNTANENIANSNTEQGRMNLIGQINAKPRTQGMNTFDNILLQAGGGREKLAQAATANQDVKGALDTSAQAIRGQIGRADDPSTPDVDESAGAIGQTNKVAGDTYKQIQDALGNWNTGLQGKVKTANDQRLAIANEISGRQDDPATPDVDESLQFSQGMLGAMGLENGADIYNTDLGAYLNGNMVEAQGSDLIDQTDLARYQALQDLSGGGADKQLGQGYNPYANVDKEGLAGTLANKKATFEAAKAGALQNAQDMAVRMTSRYTQDPVFNAALTGFTSDPSPENFKKLKDSTENLYNYYKQYPQYAQEPEAKAIVALHDQAAPVYSSLATGKKVSQKEGS